MSDSLNPNTSPSGMTRSKTVNRLSTFPSHSTRISTIEKGNSANKLPVAREFKESRTKRGNASGQFDFKTVLEDIHTAHQRGEMYKESLSDRGEDGDPSLPARTKIICTLGPASKSIQTIKELLYAGMNVCRLNFSHGTHEYHKETIAMIKRVRRDQRRVLAIMLDTKGPEIRTALLENGKDVELVKGNTIVLDSDPTILGNANRVGVRYANLPKVVDIGSSVLIDDGLIELEVVDKTDTDVTCLIKNDGELGSNKGVNLPGVVVDLPAVTEKDKADIRFGVTQGIDYVAASFVRSAAGVREIRSILDETRPGKHVRIIAKIENQEGLDNIDEIIAEADGIMVARGDLGVEIPLEEVTLAQKMMIQKCNHAGKVVITATQMLESMVSNPSPTRAEASDVGNAVLDGTDCVMLSGETAKGDYPVAAVKVMSAICKEVENFIDFKSLYSMIRNDSDEVTLRESVASSAVKTSNDLDASALLVLTETGNSAWLVSKYRPKARVLAVTSSEITARRAMLWSGVIPIIVSSMQGSYSLINRVVSVAVKLKVSKLGDTIVATLGHIEGLRGSTNEIRVLQVEE